MTPRTKFWSMDVPGRDPVVLLWVWWVSLALSHSLKLASFPVRIPVQSSVLSANDTFTSLVFFFPQWLVIVVTRYPQSPNRNQQASRHARIPRIFSFLADLYIVFNFEHQTVHFRLVFRELCECSKNLSMCLHFSRTHI